MGHFTRYPAAGPYMGGFRTEKRVLARKTTKSPGYQQHYHSDASPGVANSGSVFETQAPIQRALCAPWMMEGLSPALCGVTVA